MLLRRLLALFALIFAVAWSAETPAPAPVNTVILIAGRVIDPVSGQVLTNQLITIEGDKIKSIAPRTAAAVGVNSPGRVLDFSDATILPGLIDCHTHITSQPEDYYADRFRKSPIDVAVTSHVYARRTLEAGFTTVRNVGAGEYIDFALKRAIDNGKVAGPRIVASGLTLSATGGHGDLNGFSPYLRMERISNIADGPEAVRKLIRQNIKYGAEWIKISATAGVLSEEESVGAPQYSEEEMRAAVEEAAMWGRKVAAHAHGTEGIKRAIRAGVGSIEHASFIDEEGIALAKERGTYLVMDIYNDDYILAEFSRMGYPEKIIEKERLVGRVQRENFQKAHRAGVKMAYGTDAGVYPHGWNGKQFFHMVKWGMTPMEAIQAATVHAADLLNLRGKIGVIAPGAFADLIAVRADPLADVTVLEKVDFVMKGGEIYKDTLHGSAVRRFD